MATGVMHDPLTINLRRQVNILLSTVPASSLHEAEFLNASSSTALLAVLSKLLAESALTVPVAILFRPILFVLCASWLESEAITDDQFVALCLLLEIHEELFPILNRVFTTLRFENGPIPDPIEGLDPSCLHRLLLAYYRILRANRALPRHLFWPLSPLSTIIRSSTIDNGVRLLAIRCYALQSGMGEAEREKMECEIFGEPGGVDCPTQYGEDPEGNVQEVDGWILPVLEYQRIRKAREQVLSGSYDYYTINDGEPFLSISPSEVSSLVANVHGVFLLRSPGSGCASESGLISTPSAIQALQCLALHLSLRLPTLLTSPPSSGKSLYLSHLAGLLYPEVKNQIIYVQLADTSLDPRALLGSYVSSATQPGTFEWKEGVLVRSMREGKWIVFEDIDRGSNEVLGVIKPLVESMGLGRWVGGRATIQVPNRGRVVAHDGFALFATRSSLPSQTGAFPSPAFFGAHKFHEITALAPSSEELRVIFDAKFPRLAGSATVALIRLWDAIKAVSPATSARDIGLRELEKFVVRVHRLLPPSYQSIDQDVVSDSEDGFQTFPVIFPNPTLREHMFSEARDVFFGAGSLTTSAKTHLSAIAAVVADHLGLDVDRRDWILHGRIPDFDVERDVNGAVLAVRIGHVHLASKKTKPHIKSHIVHRFAMHKPAVLLLSRIATAVSLSEPVLLTGETGTGKTSAVTHLAGLLSRSLVSLNLSHQTESSDLLGGFKPIDAKVPGGKLQERWLRLFTGTFSRRKNEKFEGEVRKAVGDGKWKRAVALWKESGRLAKERIHGKTLFDQEHIQNPDMPRKRRKIDEDDFVVSEAGWATFLRDVEEFEVHHVHGQGKFAFGFVEGPLVKALRSGDWVLLDEINLASSETLECISGILHGPTSSIVLTEEGSLEPVPRHPDFRLFACMNPATDVGKKDLPPNIRSRFTEIDVLPPDADKDTLLSIIQQYISDQTVSDKAVVMDVAEFYSAVKGLAEERKIADGANHRPYYSMRTLARALTFVADTAGTFGLRRAIWEGCLMAFTMVLDEESAAAVTVLAQKHLLAGVRNPRSLLMKSPHVPRGRAQEDFVKFGPFYLERGPLPEDLAEDYVLTPSVEAKLIDLARIILTRRFPVLIEGPTSSGKTSSVEYLARRTGHRFIRINNHEHTDIQEYLGSYVSDPATGKLTFRDGLLVRALRNGDWIVLDELNLAPTDVLEALNRLLDDNRELVITETQEVVKPHPHFMLFATQNPPGLYAGRKVLSRAFRNRFLEVHFKDVPQIELETILCQRCCIAPSYGKKIVQVFHDLQKRRQTTRVFESKHGFATLRDLFRWAGRDAVGYQELAENGYMLLAERSRRDDDKLVVKEVIESVMNVKIDMHKMYDVHNRADVTSYLGCPLPTSSGVVWTNAMRRLFTLVSRALRFNEPVLLVGETGSGKTSVCQIYAGASSQRLYSLNLHQNTETADLIGGLRPVRNRSIREADLLHEATRALLELGVDAPASVQAISTLIWSLLEHASYSQHHQRLSHLQQRLAQFQSIFEWQDGPLIEAMQNGGVFLLDEISLADDSVLERLNSVLEPGRSIVLAEKGGEGDLIDPAIRAADEFKLVATMNPGGDYGKKELSPALRNRFTEIWVPPVDQRYDLSLIVSHSWNHEDLRRFTNHVLDFIDWLSTRVADQSLIGLRDILSWVEFMNAAYKPGNQGFIHPEELFHHAAHMTFLDGLGSLPQLSSYTKDAMQRLLLEAASKLMELVPRHDLVSLFSLTPIRYNSNLVQFGCFAIERGRRQSINTTFNLEAPTAQQNAMRLVRACQVYKPILLEGSPGVGKTSLVTALANATGHELYRINLSDQTDLIDLFGTDLPVEGGAPGEFAWKDGEFLKALQEGHWVLLDEMNLAPQSILEGLNAVLDHRGTVFIPELGKSFVRHSSFRIFAAQNPLSQGGGRKGLPRSFINRFTKVYVEELSPSDFLFICRHLFPRLDEGIIKSMISYNMRLQDAVVVRRSFAREGSPWEFNLRDVIRWGSLLHSASETLHPAGHLRTIYLHRFRTLQDRKEARILFDSLFSTSRQDSELFPRITISPSHIQIGHLLLKRNNLALHAPTGRILKSQLPVLESLGYCVSQSWLSILTGTKNSGKTTAVRVLAHFTGNFLQEISIHHATDTMDILGGFEQVDPCGQALSLVNDVLTLLDNHFRSNSESQVSSQLACNLHRACTSSASSRTLLQMAMEIVGQLSPSSLVSALSSRISACLAVSDAVGRFEWVDGPLVKAMKFGHWLLLDGANLCNPSVLDRLNSLCEQGGVLALSERGYVDGQIQIISPHPNFRLFMTVDPQYGELSRAMRNRGIEIAIVNSSAADDLGIIADFWRLPATVPYSCLSAMDFDALRRGLINTPVSLAQASASSGRALDQESSLSSLIDRAPAILDSTGSLGLSDAHFFFLARVIEPASAPFFTRLLVGSVSKPGFDRVHNFLCSFPSHRLHAILLHLRETYRLRFSLPIDIVLNQPNDYFLNAPLCDDQKTALDTPSPHDNLLQTLDLDTAIFLYENQVLLNMVPEDWQEEITPQQKHTVKEVSSLLSLMHSVACSLLNDSSESSHVFMIEDQKLASTLLGYGRDMHEAITSSSFDFSALYTVCRWVHQAVEKPSLHFITIANQARILSETISLSLGGGLMEIWSNLFIDAKMTPSATLQNLDDYSSRLLSKQALGLRRETLHLMAIQTLPGVLQPNENLAVELEADLETVLSRHVGDESDSALEPALLAAELDLFQYILRSPDWAIYLSEILELILGSTSPLLRVTPYQHLLWAQGAQSNVHPILVQAKIQWLLSIWNTPASIEIINGPSKLLQPIQLAATLSIFDKADRSLNSFETYEKEIRQTITSINLLCKQTRSRVEKLTGFLSNTLSLVVMCFSVPLAPAACDDQKSNQVETAISSIHELLSCVDLANNMNLKLAAEKHLRTSFLRLREAIDRNSQVTALGLLFVAVGSMIMDLFIPNVPVDPAVVQNYAADRWRRDNEIVTQQILLHKQLEEVVTGNNWNEVVNFLQRPLLYRSRDLSGSRTLPIRGNLPRLRSFWSEVWQFRDQVLSSKLNDLLSSMASRSNNAVPREAVIQQSMAGFLQRLDAAYSDFDDLKSPLKLAILHVRFGLRLVAYSAMTSPTTASSVSVLIAFPSLRGSDTILTNSVTAPLPISPFSRVLLVAAAVASLMSSGVKRPSEMDDLDTTYQQAMHLWLIDRAKEKDADAATKTLYRSKTQDHDIMAEAEIEEQEFLELFPTFGDVMEPEVGTRRDHKPSDSPHHISTTEAHILLEIHTSLFCSEDSRDSSHIINNFNQLRITALKSILPSHSESLPDTLDHESIAFQLSLMYKTQFGISAGPEVGNSYNFYADPNIPAVKKAQNVLRNLKNQIETLIDEWPDQMVLRHLRTRCEVVLALSMLSPVAKVLSALEQLLLQTEDWEMYASRENSLKPRQQELIGLIVEWRRLELSCWHGLLESQATSFAEGVSEWWFKLYDALVRGPLDFSTSDDTEGLTQYLNTLIPLLDDFIRSSPLGQFRSRTCLLRTFESYLCQLGAYGTEQKRVTFNRVGRIIHNTRSSYDIFSSRISTRLAEQRAVLEKEIREFIKLASWKDINVQALKASAQRTHHQLYKIVKKFRNILREPVTELLRPQLADAFETECLPTNPQIPGPDPPLIDVCFPEGENNGASSGHLLNLPRTYSRYKSEIETSLGSFIHSNSATLVDDLAVNIIVTSKELASIGIPPASSKDKRSKQQKALVVRKRKAWSDLLKELKRAGLSANVNPDILRRNEDLGWLLDQPLIPATARISRSADKSESYYIRVCAMLPELRSLASNHHSDLTTRDLQRGLGFLEFNFFNSVDLRSRLAISLERYDRLKGIWQRLRTVSHSPIAFSGPRVDEHTNAINNVICRLSCALQEVQAGAKVYNELDTKNKIPESFFLHMQNILTSSITLRDQLGVIRLNVASTSVPVLLEDELHVLREGATHFSTALQDLCRWADAHSGLDHLIRPVHEWLQTQDVPELESFGCSAPSEDTTNTLINVLLVTVQSLITRYSEVIRSEEDDNYILKGYRVMRDLTYLLNIEVVTTKMEAVLLHIIADAERTETILQRILPFLKVYVDLVEQQLAAHSQWTKALFKLDFVLCSVMLTLSRDGFCQPPDTEELGAGEESEETSGGVGLGDGSGEENVSKEIEEESQVEGLKGDDERGQKDGENGAEDAIEMSEDFGGNIEDAPAGSSDDDDKTKSDLESDLDPEERLQDLDPSDPSAVDEKLWADDRGSGDMKAPEKTDQDRSKERPGESEVVAKQEKKETPSKGDAKPEKPEQEGREELPTDGEENFGVDGAPIDDYIQEADTLDLPDNMNLCEDDANLGEPDTSDDAMEDEEEPVDAKVDGDQELEDSQMDKRSEEDHSPEDVPREIDQGQESEQAHTFEDENEASQQQESDTHEEGTFTRPDIAIGDSTLSEDIQRPDQWESTAMGEGGGTHNEIGRDVAASDERKETERKVAKKVPTFHHLTLYYLRHQEISHPKPATPQSTEIQSAGAGASGDYEGLAPSRPEVQLSTNPLRSLGDALKEIRHRFDDILSSGTKEVPRDMPRDVGTASQLEYLQPGDEDYDMQTLGPAGEEQAAKLNELKLLDGDDQTGNAGPMDIDQPQEQEWTTQPPHSEPSRDSEARAIPERNDGVEGAITSDDQPSGRRSVFLPEIESNEDKEMNEDLEYVEVQLRDWQAQGFPEVGAENLWRLYGSITHDLSNALCEQLRLILEPTLATRLKGDYRTGKRLNMKKVIAYIASDYTKDKIWLRRTRPSQREYQVLIAIDDSRSMAESHSIHLAYETLALVSKALSRLEAGDIAIAKFGETVEMLHGFNDGPFTDQAGTKIINAFRFDQKATNVLSLVETSLKFLEIARERRSSGADLWQLEFIISDGMCQDHERLRTVLRKAEEQRVMIVFVILDSLHTRTGTSGPAAAEAGSILTMDKAEFREVDGRMELQLRKYLDSFPFEYYVVLRNVEALPEVLAGTLRQFFERVSEE